VRFRPIGPRFKIFSLEAKNLLPNPQRMFTQYIQTAHKAAAVTRIWYVNRDAVTSSRE